MFPQVKINYFNQPEVLSRATCKEYQPGDQYGACLAGWPVVFSVTVSNFVFWSPSIMLKRKLNETFLSKYHPFFFAKQIVFLCLPNPRFWPHTVLCVWVFLIFWTKMLCQILLSNTELDSINKELYLQAFWLQLVKKLLLIVCIIPVWISLLACYLLKWDSDHSFHASQTLSV